MKYYQREQTYMSGGIRSVKVVLRNPLVKSDQVDYNIELNDSQLAQDWAQALKKDGITLKEGDLLSLGGYIPPQPTKAGMKVQVRYIGLPGNPAVSVELY